MRYLVFLLILMGCSKEKMEDFSQYQLMGTKFTRFDQMFQPPFGFDRELFEAIQFTSATEGNIHLEYDNGERLSDLQSNFDYSLTGDNFQIKLKTGGTYSGKKYKGDSIVVMGYTYYRK